MTRPQLAADFAISARSQASVAPIQKAHRHWKDKGTARARFEIATGVVHHAPVVVPPPTPAELQGEPRTPRKRKPVQRNYVGRPCDCCKRDFVVVSGVQKHCQTCRELVPARLRCSKGRVPYSITLAKARNRFRRVVPRTQRRAA